MESSSHSSSEDLKHGITCFHLNFLTLYMCQVDLQVCISSEPQPALHCSLSSPVQGWGWTQSSYRGFRSLLVLLLNVCSFPFIHFILVRWISLYFANMLITMCSHLIVSQASAEGATYTTVYGCSVQAEVRVTIATALMLSVSTDIHQLAANTQLASTALTSHTLGVQHRPRTTRCQQIDHWNKSNSKFADW